MFKKRIVLQILILTIFISLKSHAQENVRHLLYDLPELEKLKEDAEKGSSYSIELISRANKALNKGPYSVTFEKTKIAPSGDVHDYISQAPYWWPDPKKADGLPYIRRDGRRNPEIYLLHDRTQIGDLTSVVEDLALGYFLSGDEKYAKKANELLKTFFISPSTKMNPNLTYAQYIPGLNDGRGIGIIESRGLITIPESIALIQNSKSLTEDTRIGVKSWFAMYLRWLNNSVNGKSERLEKNNHGTNFDLQAIDFALYLGDDAQAKDILLNTTIPRLDIQFAADGQQPLETARTNSWDYVNMNLDAWLKLARLAEHVHIDLWNKTNNRGSGIKKAVEWLNKYYPNHEKWPYQQLNKFDNGQIKSIMERAKIKFPTLPIK